MSFNYQTTHTVSGHTSGNNVDINFTFDYLDEDDVKVYKTDTSGTALVLGTNWQFQNKKRVRILDGTANVGTIADNDVFIIQRQTNVATAYINYAPGSAIRAEDLNNNQLQALYSAQEREERGIPSTGGTVTGNIVVNAASVVFEGTTDDANETTITAVDPTADRTINIPNQSGTLPVLAAASNTAITATPEELNVLDGITSTVAELNILDGVTATAAEINTLDGITSTVTELNILDGVTATTAEINHVDGVTSNIQTQLDAKQPLDAELTELATMGSATASSLADLTGPEVQTLDGVTSTTAELNILDGVTATAAEINILDGVTSTAAELNILDGATVTATELNTLDGVNSTLTAADLNQLDSNTLVTSPTWTSDTQFPSANAIDDRITARIDPIGGFEAIADEDSFPATAPPEGTIISIANAGGMVIPAAATCTDATRAGGSDTVTIQNIPANMQSQTIQDGLGMLVIATSTAHTYDFHRVVATNADVIQLSSDINDFQARYRVGASNPTTSLDEGDLFYNTGSDTLLVYDGSAWGEVQSVGNFFIIPDAELNPFTGNGGTTLASTTTISNAPANASQVVLSINGVIQEPNAGTAAPADGFALDGSTIRLAATPAANSDVWGVIIGSTVNIGTPSDNTVDADILQTNAVTTVKINDLAVTTAKIADDAVTAAKLADSTSTDADRAVTRNHIRDDAIDGTKIADDAINSEHYADGSIDHAHLSDDCVDGDNIAADVALTGNPTATTQTAGNNTTRIATTAFVTTAVAAVNTDLVNDTTPQLGGNLDVNGNQIVSVSNGDISIQPNGTGTVEVKRASSALNTLTDAATIAVDLSLANNHTVTLGGNRTLGNPTNAEPGQTGSIFIVQDGTGGRTLTPAANWHFAKGGAHPTFSTAANAVDRIDYIVRTTTSIHCVATFNYS